MKLPWIKSEPWPATRIPWPALPETTLREVGATPPIVSNPKFSIEIPTVELPAVAPSGLMPTKSPSIVLPAPSSVPKASPSRWMPSLKCVTDRPRMVLNPPEIVRPSAAAPAWLPSSRIVRTASSPWASVLRLAPACE